MKTYQYVNSSSIYKIHYSTQSISSFMLNSELIRNSVVILVMCFVFFVLLCF
jgi:hypothetical protein